MKLFSKFRHSFACTTVALAVSYTAAALLNMSPYAWPLVERMPQALLDAMGRVLFIIIHPLLPSGVHEQEEMLDLLLVWVFSGLAFIPLVTFICTLWHDLRRSRAPSKTQASSAKFTKEGT